MGVETDVKSVRLAASGVARDVRTRVKGVYIVHSAAASTLQLRDGGAAGTILLELDVPAANTSPVWVEIPGNGVLFGADVYATFGASVVAATLFYTS